MAVHSATFALLEKKVGDIATLIKHSDKDLRLRQRLEKQFSELVEEKRRIVGSAVTPANAASVRKQVEELQQSLDTFKRWAVKKSELRLPLS